MQLSYADASAHNFNELVKSGRIRIGRMDRPSPGSTEDIATAVASKLQPMIIAAVKPMVASLVQPMMTDAMSTAITSAVNTAIQSVLPGNIPQRSLFAESSSTNAVSRSEPGSHDDITLPTRYSPLAFREDDNEGETASLP